MALYYRKEDKTHSIYTMPSTFPASSVTFDRTAVASDYRPDASWLASGNIQNALAEVNHNICSKDICMDDVETTDQAQYEHAAGTYFIWKGSYAKAIAAIAVSDTITSGTGGNVEVTSISGELSKIANMGKSNLNNTVFKDITDDFTSGTFSAHLDEYNPGNYILKSYGGNTYAAVLADYNYYFNPGRDDYANINNPHWVAIILGFTAGQMNTTNTTAGGFKGSAMNTWLKGDCTTAIKNAFGIDHLYSHSCWLSTGTYNASAAPNYGFSWEEETGVYAMLMTEAQMHGTRAFGFSHFDTAEANRQLKIFQNNSFMEVLGKNYGQSNATVFNSSHAWLRDISADSPGATFAAAAYGGNACGSGASLARGRFAVSVLH